MSLFSFRRPERLAPPLLVLCAVLFLLVRGVHDERRVLHFRDFKQPYASARCLLHGCNPYSEEDTRAEFLRAGGQDDDAEVFRAYSALYPPFSLAVLTPVAALPYPAAHLLWMTLIGLLYAAAVGLTAELCASFGLWLPLAALLALFAATSTILLMLGQVSGPVIALLVIGFWCLMRGVQPGFAVAAFTLALLLKPHDAVLLVCYLPLADRRWRSVFAATMALTAVLAAAGCLWCAHQPASAHWVHDLRANLHGNAAPGGANDPGRGSLQGVNMANVQALLTPVAGRSAGAVAGDALAALLLLGWAVPAYRLRPSLEKHVLSLGAMSCLMLLPIYHRQYDTRVLLLLFPAAAMLLRWRPRSWGAASLTLLLPGTMLSAHSVLQRLAGQHAAAMGQAGGLSTALLYRPLPLLELVLGGFLLAGMYAYARAEREAEAVGKSMVYAGDDAQVLEYAGGKG